MGLKKAIAPLLTVLLLAACGTDSNFNGTYTGQGVRSQGGSSATSDTVVFTQNGQTISGTLTESASAGGQPMSGTIQAYSNGSSLTQVVFTPSSSSGCNQPWYGTGTQTNRVVQMTLTGCGITETLTLTKTN